MVAARPIIWEEQMKSRDFMDLDGHTLRTFLTVLELSSVSKAAEKLDLTQPAVSHILRRLRQILGDPLFIRTGHRLTPTETALALKANAIEALDSLQRMTAQRAFDPRHEEMKFVIAANDMQRDLIFPRLLRDAMAEGISLELQFIPSGQPSVPWIRDSRCHLALTPLPPEASDIYQKIILRGKMMCFFDAAMGAPPRSLEEYYAAQHLSVRFMEGRTSWAIWSSNEVDKSQISRPVVTVSNFNAIPPFIKGTRLIATQMDLMRLRTLQALDVAPLPFESDPVAIHMVWHERSNNDPAHRWLRQRIETVAQQVADTMKAED